MLFLSVFLPWTFILCQMSDIAIIIKRCLLAFMLALYDNEKFEGKLNPDERAKWNEFFLIQYLAWPQLWCFEDKSQLGVDFYLKIRSRILFFFFLYRILNDPSKILEKKVLQKLQVPKNVYNKTFFSMVIFVYSWF